MAQAERAVCPPATAHRFTAAGEKDRHSAFLDLAAHTYLYRYIYVTI